MRFFVGLTTSTSCSATIILGALLGMVALAPTQVQSQAAAGIVPAFQSISVTSSQSTNQFARIDTQEGIANFSAYSLRELIEYAYGVNAPQIVGGPDWIASAKYDIRAKALGGNLFNFEQMKKCVEASLASQFNLVFHREQRVIPIYELVVGAEGLKLEGPQFAGSGQSRIVFTSGHVEASNVNMSAFSQGLAMPTGRFVVNKTGIAGSYDFSVDWVPSQNAGSSISGALERQLGLRLKPATGAVEVFVVDRVEKPHS